MCLAHLLEGRREGLDQLGRQLLDEPDRVGEDDQLAGRQLETPGGGVQGGEEQVVGEHLAVGEDVEQRRLACVRVPDQRARRERNIGPRGAPRTALPFDHHEAFAKSLELLADEAPVHLDLLLTRAASEPDAAALALEVGPPAGEAGEQVLELRHLDLHPALGGDGSAGEDGEDHLGAIQHRDAPFLLQVALLAGGQLIVAEHRRAVELGEMGGKCRDHAGAEEGRGMRLAQRDQAALEDLGAEGASQLLELVELDVALLALVPAGGGADDDHPLQLRADRRVSSRWRVEMGQLARHRPGHHLEHPISLPTAPAVC